MVLTNVKTSIILCNHKGWYACQIQNKGWYVSNFKVFDYWVDHFSTPAELVAQTLGVAKEQVQAMYASHITTEHSYSSGGNGGGSYSAPAPPSNPIADIMSTYVPPTPPNPAQPAQPLLPPGSQPIIIKFAEVSGRSGIGIARAIWALVKTAGVKIGTKWKIGWGQLPEWVRIALQWTGISAAIDFLFDEGEGDVGLIPLPGSQPGGLSQLPGVTILGTWTANGSKFYRLSDGRLAVQNKRGRWKVWRPKRPIVIYGGGVSNLRALLRADAVITRQTRKLSSLIRRRGGGKRGRAKTDQVINVEKTSIR